MILEEDPNVNRMVESLKLFEELTGSRWLKEISFILFLNKSDLFEEKLKKCTLKDLFEEFEGNFIFYAEFCVRGFLSDLARTTGVVNCFV